MSFKENLLRKMSINRMAKTVRASIGSSDSGRKIDKETMRNLLEMSPYKPAKERDLELYVQRATNDQQRIIVLDNELPIYETTIYDVALRKSPTIKEMVNIRNIIKIINDTDVKISRKDESLDTIQQESIGLLDLSFEKSDLDKIENEGVISLERGYSNGVIESMSLFAELLEYSEAPKAFKVNHCQLFGYISDKGNNEIGFGPAVIYNMMYNTLKWINESLNNLNKNQIKHLHNIAIGKETAILEGASVFKQLKDKIIKRYL